jgi:tetratricopeptide (TPR) repeat protein
MRPIAKRILLAGLLVLLSVPYVLAQTSGGGNTGGNAPGKGTPTPAPNPIPTQPRSNLPGIQTERGLVMITGRVVTEEGTPPPEIVNIERVCGGAARREGYTDSNGYFSLQLGATTNGIIQDASVGSGSIGPTGMEQGMPSMGTMGPDPGVTQNELMNCDLRASLSGYQSTRIPLFSARIRSATDIGILVIYKLDRSKATTISATSMRAPKKAKKGYEKGLDLLHKNKPEQATKEFENALKLYPDYAEAWYGMGLVHQNARELDEARTSYNKALELDSHFILPYIQLAYLAMQNSDWKTVLALTDRALALNPFEYPAIHFFNAVANYNLQNFEAAERSSKKADLLDSRESFPRNHLLLSRLLSQKGDYQGAADELKTYLQVQPKGNDLPEVKAELGRLETLMKTSPEQAAQPAH